MTLQVISDLGFRHLEVASCARRQGCAVILVEPQAVPLQRHVGREAGDLFAQLHARNGVELRRASTVTAVDRIGSGVRLLLSDGGEVRTDVAVCAVGSVPETAWLAESDVACDDGVICGRDGSSSSNESILAVGDVAATSRGLDGGARRSEHWAGAVEQSRTVVAVIAGKKPPAPSLPWFWTDQYDARIRSFGQLSEDHDVEVVDLRPEAHLVRYRHQGALVGVQVPCRPGLLPFRDPQARTSLRSTRSRYDSVSLPRRPCVSARSVAEATTCTHLEPAKRQGTWATRH